VALHDIGCVDIYVHLYIDWLFRLSQDDAIPSQYTPSTFSKFSCSHLAPNHMRKFMFGRSLRETNSIVHSYLDRSSCPFYRSNCLQWISGIPPLIHDRPTFCPCIHNRVQSEVTSGNSLSRSRLACSRLSGHTDYTDSNINRIRLDWRPSKHEINTHYCSQTRVWTKYNYNGHELSKSDHCLLWKTFATLVYSTITKLFPNSE